MTRSEATVQSGVVELQQMTLLCVDDEANILAV